MTANQTPGNADADLIRYLDGELDAGQRARIEASLATDSRLAQRLAVLEKRGRRMGTLLAAADLSADEVRSVLTRDAIAQDVVAAGIESGAARIAEDGASDEAIRSHTVSAEGVVSIAGARQARHSPRPKRAAKGWLRAAAILLAFSATAMLVPPVRAWVVDRIQQIVAAGPSQAPPAPPQPALVTDDIVRYGITVSGATFDITIEHAQSTGTLTVRSADVVDGQVEMRAGTAAESLLVLPGGLRITNAILSTASYDITLPAAVSRVTVRLAGGPPVLYTLDAGSPERTIALTGSRK